MPDSIEPKFRDTGLTTNPYQNNTCDDATSGGCVFYRYHKPRHTVEVTSLDGDILDIKVEVFAPGLTLDQNGALTKKPIAVNQIEEFTDPEYPLEGPVNVNQVKNQLTVFPSNIEHNVRVMEKQ